MGVVSTWCLYVVCVVVVFGVCDTCAEPYEAGTLGRPVEQVPQDVTSVCNIKGCNCTPASSDKWIVANCTFNNIQVINLRQGLLPLNLLELHVVGGQELVLNDSFSNLKNPCILRIDGTSKVTFMKGAFANVRVNNFLVQIQHCDSVIFESQSFTNEGPVTLEVSRCGHVRVQHGAFYFLQSALLQDIASLELGQGAFILKPRINERHGAVTTLRFRNVSIETLPPDVFKSTLAEVSFIDSRITSVMSEAFSGISITAINLVNCSLGHIYAAAFSQRTLLESLEVTRCNIRVIFSEAMLSATTNLTIQHSNISTIHTGALNATIARTIFINNDISTFHSKGFALNDWSQINIENNNFSHIHSDGLNVPFRPSSCQEPCQVTFTANEIGNLDPGALKFISVMPDIVSSHFENNYFNYTCHCEIDKWLEEIIGSHCPKFAATNYCIIDPLIAGCFEVPEGPALMKNFTDNLCPNTEELIKCKTYSVDANVVKNEPYNEENNSQLILGLVLGLVLLIAVIGTVVILLIQGGLWLKRKGYCVRFNNFQQYRVEEESTEVEDIMVATDKTPENHLPEELSQELLQTLRAKLDDPSTYNEAREMIERLYDHFIIEDSYTNNNRQEEETHLYEELGNLHPQNDQDKVPARPFSFLRLIEERFNLTPTEQPKSVLVGEYSEPTDAEVHLYSELPQNKEGKQNEINEGLTQRDPGTSTQRSNGSGRMAYRPLPDKPHDSGAGPSTKF